MAQCTGPGAIIVAEPWIISYGWVMLERIVEMKVAGRVSQFTLYCSLDSIHFLECLNKKSNWKFLILRTLILFLTSLIRHQNPSVKDDTEVRQFDKLNVNTLQVYVKAIEPTQCRIVTTSNSQWLCTNSLHLVKYGYLKIISDWHKC
jgi:hypothetical protein